MISRCSSPIPEMMVCPVSASVLTRNDGSSMASFASACPILSWLACVFGSMAIEMTGAGNSISSSTTGCFSSQSVSPVRGGAQTGGRRDVAAGDLVDVLALVGVHVQEAPDPLALPLDGVVDRRRRRSTLPE